MTDALNNEEFDVDGGPETATEDPFYLDDEDVQEAEGVESDPETDRASAWAAFEKSGNPEDLPEKERKIFKGFQATETRKSQELSEALRDVKRMKEELSSRVPAKDDTEPVIDPHASVEEIVEGLKKRQDWLARKTKDPRLDEVLGERELNAKFAEAAEKYREMDGVTPEILTATQELVNEDPGWGELSLTPIGRRALLTEVRVRLASKKKDKETRLGQAAQSRRTPLRKADASDIREKTKGMTMDEIVEKSMRGQL